MFEIMLPYKCIRCGKAVLYYGECSLCSSKSEYQKGMEDGKADTQWEQRKREIEEDPFHSTRCSECRNPFGHESWCSYNKPYKIDLRSDYEKGYDDGYKSSKSSSSSGTNEFLCKAQ